MYPSRTGEGSSQHDRAVLPSCQPQFRENGPSRAIFFRAKNSSMSVLASTACLALFLQTPRTPNLAPVGGVRRELEHGVKGLTRSLLLASDRSAPIRTGSAQVLPREVLWRTAETDLCALNVWKDCYPLIKLVLNGCGWPADLYFTSKGKDGWLLASRLRRHLYVRVAYLNSSSRPFVRSLEHEGGCVAEVRNPGECEQHPHMHAHHMRQLVRVDAILLCHNGGSRAGGTTFRPTNRSHTAVEYQGMDNARTVHAMCSCPRSRVRL